MKLYATLTSERASKSQGGNEYIDIDILVGHKDNNRTLAKLTVRPDSEGYGLYDHTDTKIAEVTDAEFKIPKK